MLVAYAPLPRRTIYNMCTQKPPYDYSEQLYQRYRETFNNYLNEKVGLARDPCTAPHRAVARRLQYNASHRSTLPYALLPALHA